MEMEVGMVKWSVIREVFAQNNGDNVSWILPEVQMKYKYSLKI